MLYGGLCRVQGSIAPIMQNQVGNKMDMNWKLRLYSALRL